MGMLVGQLIKILKQFDKDREVSEAQLFFNLGNS